jgi:hypothetical protein
MAPSWDGHHNFCHTFAVGHKKYNLPLQQVTVNSTVVLFVVGEREQETQSEKGFCQ